MRRERCHGVRRGAWLERPKTEEDQARKDEAFPVHNNLLTNNGIHIIENVRTDLIAAEAATSKRGTFFLSMTVPKAVGLTGTFVNIEAIR